MIEREIMRVITGEYKGRKINAPEGLNVRPTGDKIKGAVFNMLADEIIDATVIDLFAGSGSLAIEALSRGAAKCIFIDNSRDSIATINDNLRHISGGRGDDRAITCTTVEQADFRIALRRYGGIKANIVLADPPYEGGYYEEIMQLLDRYDIIIPGGILVLESPDRLDLPDESNGFAKQKERKHGKTKITIYERIMTE